MRASLGADLGDPLFRNAYALAINTFGNAAFGLLYWILAARYYSPKVVGASSALIAALMLVSTVSQLNLGSALTRFLPRSGHGGRRLILAAYAVSASFAFLLAVLSAPWLTRLGKGMDLIPRPARLWLAGSLVVWVLFALQDHVLTGLRRAVWVPAENGVFGLLKIGVLVALASAAPHIGIFASWVLPMALLVVPVNLLIFRRLFRSAGAGNRGELLRARQIGPFVAVDYLASLFSLASTQLLPVLIAIRLGPEANAYFYVAWVFVATLDFALLSVTSSLTVEGSHDERKLPALTRALGRRLGMGGLVIVVPILAGAPLLLRMFGPRYAAEASTLLRLLVLGMVPRGVVILWMATARVRKEMKPILASQGVASALVLGLSALLLGAMGTIGAGIAYLTGQTVVALAVIPRLRTLVRSSSPEQSPGVVPPRSQDPEVPSPADVSVVVTAKNAEGSLGECLSSVVSCQPAEIIMVDGLSTDGTVEVAKRFGARVISDQGRGLPVARAMGASAARSKWVALVDADVVLAPDSLRSLLAEFIEDGYCGLQAGLRSVSGRGYWGRALVHHHRHGWSRRWFGLAATLFERSVLLSYGLDRDFLTGEDLELRCRLKDAGERVGVSRRTVAIHRFEDTFEFAKHQWVSDGRGFARVLRKRGLRASWLLGVPATSALWGIAISFLRLRPIWVPYYLCFLVFNYGAMFKQLLSGAPETSGQTGKPSVHIQSKANLARAAPMANLPPG